DIPASSGWHQVFGSIAVFLFLTQVFTGILLAFNYAPTPGEAYNSLKYIVTELTGGRMIRGLHHWGASMMIVVVVLHMCQVAVYGAYKKPREATWMVGVVLLLLTLAYGLTGYLLPWDNRAYWGTVVTTQIAAQAPIAGPYLTRLLGGEGSIGVVTFARFYAMHVMLLPPLTTFLIALHIYLVRKHGVAPAPDDFAPKKKFYPQQVFKDTVAVFIAFAILYTLAIAVKVPLERIADPTDTSYIPRPEWYFLFLFQTLKFFEGKLELVGSMVLPGLAITSLFLLPFIDRGAMKKVRERTLAMGILAFAILGWGGLTAAAIATTPKVAMSDMADSTGSEDWQQLTPEELAGVGLYRRENCASCHGAGSKLGPDLARPASRKDAAWMIAHFKRPQEMTPGTSMPPVQLPDSQLNALAAFLLKLNPNNETVIDTAPAFAVEGAIIYQANKCGMCHQVNGSGVKMGPPLNGVAEHRTREWIEEHFRDPQKMSKGTPMPPYKFNSKDMDRITSYLMALPKT
ncbi:MAG TPA: cytochrome b N-terminal domain-containing protein, partial [Bryobacteraceae bacterium]|nr:cytochrome b N-terminal domain-containing protein [Bryobacteraceae bacterium]